MYIFKKLSMRTPTLISTMQELRKKMKLIEALEDIEVAIKALNQESKIENPIDRNYDQLECLLKPLEQEDEMFKLINEYLQKTHAPTHNNYKLKLLEVYEAKKLDEHKNFKDLGNRMLLWHGSRLTNWAGILRQGLKIAPPEAPVTGYMVNK
jgi:poly [ADP-ribose] polymerase 2/3/4